MTMTYLRRFRCFSKQNKPWHWIFFEFVYLLSVTTLILVYLRNKLTVSFIPRTEQSISQEQYLINTPNCKIVNRKPFGEDVIKYFTIYDDIKCNTKEQLTYIKKTKTSVTLHINNTLLLQYSRFPLTCCYSSISQAKFNPDYEVVFSACQSFKDTIQIFDNLIKVTCGNFFSTVYSNVHAVIQPFIQNQIFVKKSQNFNVILLGIDSISKLNLQRTMPKTYKFLETTQNFHSLRGYTKIEDNTFPNLMAILTGKNMSQLYSSCNISTQPLNNCNFVWKDFKAENFVTAFVEDEAWMSTFNHYYKGFSTQPTDFYFRPYILAAETLPSSMRHQLHYCTGPENTAERITNLATDFIETEMDQAKFGLFWINSFSHNNINGPTAMDVRILRALETLLPKLTDTILIFFSDHGFRFGKIRRTFTGWLEERLPFIYLHFPDRFERKFPQQFANFIQNKQKLTNPFDIYLTMQELLSLQATSYKPKKSPACPNCHSLLTQIPENRTCKEAAISNHYCLCSGYNYVNPKNELVEKIAQFVVEQINILIRSYSEGENCARLYLDQIQSAKSTFLENANGESVVNYRVLMSLRPPSMFEATVEVRGLEMFRLVSEVSRLDRYSHNAKCVGDSIVAKYCYCDSAFNSIISALCVFADCL